MTNATLPGPGYRACDTLDESGRVDSADDQGAGSCMPDTCAF
jgi:hypothetical protein